MKRLITFLLFLGLVNISLQSCEYKSNDFLRIVDKWWTDGENPQTYDNDIFCSEVTLSSLSVLKYYDYKSAYYPQYGYHREKELYSALIVVNSNLTTLSSFGLQDNSRLKGLKFNNNFIKNIDPSTLRTFHVLEEICLTQNNITSLPDGLFASNNRLKIVDLSYNNISTISNATFPSDSITHLNLRHNQLQKVDFKLPESIINLELSFNLISYIIRNAFSGMARLQTLKLNDNIIKTLPVGLFALNSNFQELDLSHNNISSVGRVALLLSNIENLNLQNNKLRTLDFTFPLSLKCLDLSLNAISFMHNDTFSGMVQLSKLKLNNNRLETLPEGLFSPLDRLKELNLEHNNIHFLASGLFASNNLLETVDLTYNNISAVEDTALQSKSIQRLNLQYNNIRNVNFTMPASLQYLDLSYNAIEQIHESCFFEMVNMTELNLSHNFLKTIPSGLFKSLKSARHINLQYNDITFLPNRLFGSNDSLMMLTLNLSYNKISFINKESFPTRGIAYLHLQHNKLKNLNFTLPASLKLLNLSFNLLSVIEKDSFQNVTALDSLWLNDNLLQTLPAGCFKTKNEIHELYLSNNRLTMTFGTFTGLRNVTTLSIANNSLTNLPELVLNDLENLAVLDISNNLLTNLEVQDITKHLKKLKSVTLKGNRFGCKFLFELITQFEGSGVEVAKGDEFFESNVRGITCIHRQQSNQANNSGMMQGNILVDGKEAKQTLKDVVTDLLSEKERTDNIFEKQLQQTLEEISVLLKNSSTTAQGQLALISEKLLSNSSVERFQRTLEEINSNLILTRKMSSSSEEQLQNTLKLISENLSSNSSAERLQRTLEEINSNLILTRKMSSSSEQQLQNTLKLISEKLSSNSSTERLQRTLEEINSNLIVTRKMPSSSEEQLQNTLKLISEKLASNISEERLQHALQSDFTEKEYLRLESTDSLETSLRNMSTLISNNYGNGNNATYIFQTLILCVFLLVIIMCVLYYFYKQFNARKDRHVDSLTEMSSLQALQE